MRLSKVDLARGNKHEHPDIKLDGTQYLVKIGDKFFAGTFHRQWYGLNFGGWYGGTLQFDTPGSNCSLWEGIWEIRGG